MTAKHRRGLLPPKPPVRFNARDCYGKTRLDLSFDEVRPDRLEGLIGWSRLADSQTSKSELIRECLIRIDAALAHTAVSEIPEVEWDLRGLCADAKLTERQTEVIVLAGEGWSQRAIGEWLHIGQATVGQHLRYGRAKLVGWLPLVVASRLAAYHSEGV